MTAITTDLKSRISAALQAFASQSSSQQAQTLRHAALAFFKELGYASDRTLPPCSVAQFCSQFDAKGELNHKTALKADWQSADLLFQLTDEELSLSASLFKDTTVAQSRAASYVFFAIQLQAKDYTRSQLAAVTRRLNRVFPMPVMVLYQFGEPAQPCLSIAVINRRANKKDADKDVLGKVTLIHHIAIAAPHRGHVDIIASFAASELGKTQRIDSFDALHAAWEAVFNVELLNKRFYEELAKWYFWARGQVRFPADLEPDEATRNATSVIRLLTRLIFVWFLKEKNLIPNSLFDPAHLATVLKDWKTHQGTHDTSKHDTGIYYRAILQNLFFATLNQEMGSDGKPSPRQFVTNDGHLSNRTHHGIKTLYRYDECFHSQAQTLALFEGIPFLNGGLFACLDIENAANKVQYADGFTRIKTKQAQVPDALFFAQPHFVDLSAAYGDKKKPLPPCAGSSTF
jgi:adenine-specific DNA-methyltransferase